MPWAEQSVMDQRLSFIAACLRQEEAMSQLCLRHGISRKTGYKWLSRYREAGVVGLADLSSVPRTLASAASGYVVAQIGWFDYFLVCTALAVPGMLLLLRIAPWRTRS